MRSIKHKTTSGKSIDLKKERKKLKGISRIDSTNTHGWFVRVYRNDVIYSKLFSDSRYGDKDKALNAAKAYRDEFEILLDRKDKYPRRNNRLPVVTKNRRNKTGVVGVCHRKRRLPSGKVAECYSVTWAPEPNVQKCTSFSIAKYGKRQAFKKAKELREKMVKSMMGEESLPKSTKKSRGRRYQKAEKVMKKLRRKQDPKRNMAA